MCLLLQIYPMWCFQIHHQNDTISGSKNDIRSHSGDKSSISYFSASTHKKFLFSTLKDKAGFGCIFLYKWLSRKPRGEFLLLSQLKYDSAGSAELDELALQCLMLKAKPVLSPPPLQSKTLSMQPFVHGVIEGCIGSQAAHIFTST